MESSSSSRKVELPSVFDQAHINDLVRLIADMLTRLMAHNDQIPLLPEYLTRFHSRSAPGISVLDYLKRIVKFTNVEKSCLLVTLQQIDQFCARMPLFALSSLTCHRFIITSITVSSKGLSDTFCTNQLYAKVGGISVSELNVLERELLSAIDWRLMCTREILQEYYINLVRTHSSGAYCIVGADWPRSSSDADFDIASRPPSPRVLSSSGAPHQILSVSDTSTIVVEPGSDTVYRPTVEQNMAFAALQRSQDLKASEGSGQFNSDSPLAHDHRTRFVDYAD